MALNTTQADIERSIFEAINQCLAVEGYWPLYDSETYPNTQDGIAAWQAAMDLISKTKGFAGQIFGYGSPQSRDMKRLPRITIITRRFNPGEIGNPVDPITVQNPLNPNTYQEIIRPQESMEQQIEIHVISQDAKQERVLTSIVYEALGSKSYIPWYNKSGSFFLRQFNCYDLPDSTEGILEKVHCYEAKDIYIKNDTVVTSSVPLITLINLEVLLSDGPIPSGPLPPTVIEEGSIIIDLSHIQFTDFI